MLGVLACIHKYFSRKMFWRIFPLPMMWELRENSIPFFPSTFHFECTNFQQQLTYYVSDSRLRWQAPNAQYPDKTVTTQPLSNRKSPKVIVTQSTFDSFTLSFDHFAPEDYSHEYVALFKPVSSSRWISQEEEVPKQDLPSIKITNLRPNTKYEARIGRSFGKNRIHNISSSFFPSQLFTTITRSEAWENQRE